MSIVSLSMLRVSNNFNNSAPLAHTVNRGLAEAHDDRLVVFCHDDLWLGDAPLEPALSEVSRVNPLGRLASIKLAGEGC